MNISNLLGLVGVGSSHHVEIVLNETCVQKNIDIRHDSVVEKLAVIQNSKEIPVTGKVVLRPSPGKKIEHNGARIELIGQIEMFYDRGNHFEFTSLVQELIPPAPVGVPPNGEIFDQVVLPFEFINVEKPYESYNGVNVRLRYFLRFTLQTRKALTNLTKEVDFWVFNYQSEPEVNNPIKMEVGIEENLHIEFEYEKSRYHLRDVVVGRIYFLLVKIKIKYMEISLIKRETTGSGPNLYNENETLTKFEIMDGAPVRGESIPVRLFLSPFELTPTFRNVHNKFSVKYYLNLILIDEDEKRYFKQQEITLWRKKN